MLIKLREPKEIINFLRHAPKSTIERMAVENKIKIGMHKADTVMNLIKSRKKIILNIHAIFMED
jgi:hypothetical protein